MKVCNLISSEKRFSRQDVKKSYGFPLIRVFRTATASFKSTLVLNFYHLIRFSAHFPNNKPTFLPPRLTHILIRMMLVPVDDRINLIEITHSGHTGDCECSRWHNGPTFTCQVTVKVLQRLHFQD